MLACNIMEAVNSSRKVRVFDAIFKGSSILVVIHWNAQLAKWVAT